MYIKTLALLFHQKTKLSTGFDYVLGSLVKTHSDWCLVRWLKTLSDWCPRTLIVVIVGSLHDRFFHNLSKTDSKGKKRHVVGVLVVLAIIQQREKKNKHRLHQLNEKKNH